MVEIRGETEFWGVGRAYFNMLTAGVNDPAVIRFAPAVITFCLRDIKDVIRHFACQGSKMKYEQYVRCLYNDSVAIIPPYFWVQKYYKIQPYSGWFVLALQHRAS